MSRLAHRVLGAAGLLMAALALGAGASFAAPASPASPGMESTGIVSVRVTSQTFDSVVPWSKDPDQTIQGNALVVEGRRLLTTADLVKNSTLIEVRKLGSYPDYVARRVLVDYEANLALLEVENPEFWERLKPLPLAETGEMSNQFVVSRWRTNGRFEQGSGEIVDYLVAPYRFGTMELPTLRATTAMSALGWAEVLTVGGKIAGIITSHEGQQIEATPTPILRTFLAASKRKEYRGFAHRGFLWERTNNSALRRKLDLPENGPGILVRGLLSGGTGAGQLQAGDILTRIGPYTIDPEGLIDHPQYGRVAFPVALNETLEDALPAEIVRGGKPKHVDLQRRRFLAEDYRVQPYVFDRRPDYEVQGGLVLEELSISYLRAWGKPWADRAPTRLAIEASEHSLRTQDQPLGRVVVVTKVLPDEGNLGYDDVTNAIIVTANGKPLHSLADLREALKAPVNGFQVVETLAGQGRGRLVFRAAQLDAINRRIRERYNVPGPVAPVGVALDKSAP
jgi:hypothetical protein